jgi:hypothetical protein
LKKEGTAMVTVENELDLVKKRNALKALVDDSVEKAKSLGYRLMPGAWLHHGGGVIINHPSCCLVGAIGLVRSEDPFRAKIDGVAATSMLIRNGESELVDDVVLAALSYGFEAIYDWEESMLCEFYTSLNLMDEYTRKYIEYARDLGYELRRNHPPLFEDY